MKSVILAAVVGAAAARPGAVHEDRAAPSIVHEPCEQYEQGAAFDVRARIVDDSKIFEPKVIYRAGRGPWKNAALERELGRDDFRATIRAKDLDGALEYFIEVFDENGNGPARFGSPEAPVRVLPAVHAAECQQIIELPRPVSLQVSSGGGAPGSPATAAPHGDAGSRAGGSPAVDLRVAPPPPQGTCERADRPLYCSPWLWTAAGVVIVGGGAGGYLWLAGRGSASVPKQIQLHVAAPNPVGQ